MKARVVVACSLSILLTMAGTSCTKPDDGRGVASAGGVGTASVQPTLSVQEQGLRHARCMRANGVEEADPQVLPDGTVRVGGGYSKQDVDAGLLKSAIRACKAYEVVLSGVDGERKLAGAREYSRCMRAHGVDDFPDPDANGHLPALPEEADPDFDQAKASCRAQASSPQPEPTR